MKGYSTVEIAKKTDFDDSYVTSILHLLDNGEQRLIQAVERRIMPLWLAVEVARATGDEVQQAMVAAYESKTLTGEQLLRVRRVLSRREASGKMLNARSLPREKPSPQRLLKIYKTEVRRQKLMVQNARIQEQRLLLITSAIRHFLSDDHFKTLLRAEGIRDIPEAVARRIPSELMP
ncbi:plasmid partitioning protein RepB C-terminal domain-containing protein [Burkholderia sp. 22PA0106]|uniref:plasmid partitioning protein RepB C-terminal domain-containing protein n=1 Tax=Burkholderia sp. 22PA0106 TaxID=3237371 RepID=UPI0039C1A0D4